MLLCGDPRLLQIRGSSHSMVLDQHCFCLKLVNNDRGHFPRHGPNWILFRNRMSFSLNFMYWSQLSEKCSYFDTFPNFQECQQCRRGSKVWNTTLVSCHNTFSPWLGNRQHCRVRIGACSPLSVHHDVLQCTCIAVHVDKLTQVETNRWVKHRDTDYTFSHLISSFSSVTTEQSKNRTNGRWRTIWADGGTNCRSDDRRDCEWVSGASQYKKEEKHCTLYLSNKCLTGFLTISKVTQS